MIIDTHCHLDFYKDPLEFAKRYERLGYVIIGVTNLPSYFEQGSKFLKSFKRVRLALGLHPLEAKKHTKIELEKFSILSSKTSYIGEVGRLFF
jgi:TatD DNase family protein